MATEILSADITANGNTATASWPGGEGYYTITGSNLGGGTYTLQFSHDGTNFASAGTDATLTALGGALITLPPCIIRVNTSGSTTPSVTAKVIKQ